MDTASVVLDIDYKIQLYSHTVESRGPTIGQEIGRVPKYASSL